MSTSFYLVNGARFVCLQLCRMSNPIHVWLVEDCNLLSRLLFLYGTNRAAFAQAPCTATTFKPSESIFKESPVVVDNNQILYKSQQHFRSNFKRDERLRALCRFVHDCMSSNRFQDVRQETSSEHVAVDILAKVHRFRWSFSCVFTEFDDVNWNQRIITIRAGLLGAV